MTAGMGPESLLEGSDLRQARERADRNMLLFARIRYALGTSCKELSTRQCVLPL